MDEKALIATHAVDIYYTSTVFGQSEKIWVSKVFCFLFFVHSKRDFNVKSFGSGTVVKLPGPGPDRPNIYSFTTTYDEMYKDLLRKDSQLYPALKFSPHFAFRKPLNEIAVKMQEGEISMTLLFRPNMTASESLTRNESLGSSFRIR